MQISQAGLNQIKKHEYSVYSLNHPVTGEVKYIGQTKSKLYVRLSKHICDSHNPKIKVQCWIKSLLNEGLRPEIHLIESFSLQDIDKMEVFYIKHYIDAGADLKNISPGGNVKSRSFSQETKDKISASLMGIVQSEETRRKRSISSTESWSCPKLRELKRVQTTELNRLGLIGTKGKKVKGTPRTEDQKANLSRIVTEYFKTHEHPNAVKIKLSPINGLDCISFNSITEALVYLNVTCNKYIVNRLKGNPKPYRGYIVSYA